MERMFREREIEPKYNTMEEIDKKLIGTIKRYVASGI